MKKTFAIILLLAAAGAGAIRETDPPAANISNGLIQARLYLPDAQHGYYRGSRFDWSGVIASLSFGGHNYFGQWFTEYSPTLHDAIQGPVEAFDPIGYDDANPGENFLKIGVGLITKTENAPYAFFKPYPVADPGTWKVVAKPDHVQFIHTLQGKTYAYEYEKTVTLVSKKAEMIIRHTIRNKGKQTLETEVYNHNFFVMDSQTTGPDFAITFPFELPGEPADAMKDFVKFKDHQLYFLKPLAPKEHVYIPDMTSGKNADYMIKVENSKTSAGVRITSDEPISNLRFWCSSTTVCPEPFTKVKVEPGAEFSWQLKYEFYNGLSAK